MDDDWYGNPGNSAGRTLAKRASLADIAALGGKKSFFTCNDGGQCASGACAGDACDWNPATDSFSNATRVVTAADDDDDPMDVDASQSCVNAVPAFMYNCKYFPDETIAGLPGRAVPGICRNIMQFFARSGLGSGPFHANWNIEGSGERGTNREEVCGDRSGQDFSITDHLGAVHNLHGSWAQRCWSESDVVSHTLNVPIGDHGNRNWFSCDEFPFNAMMEGGNRATNNRNCVPGYQQEIQGQLNHLPGRVLQSATWTDAKGNQKTEHKRWSESWARAAWNADGSNKKSLTFHLFNSDSHTSPTGAKYAVFKHDLVPGGGTRDQIGEVVAAINHFDNAKYKFQGDKNAWCLYKGPSALRNHAMWGDNYPRFIRVRV